MFLFVYSIYSSTKHSESSALVTADDHAISHQLGGGAGSRLLGLLSGRRDRCGTFDRLSLAKKQRQNPPIKYQKIMDLYGFVVD